MKKKKKAKCFVQDCKNKVVCVLVIRFVLPDKKAWLNMSHSICGKHRKTGEFMAEMLLKTKGIHAEVIS